MPVDKSMSVKLTRYAQIFKEARERGANESDTVMYLVKMFEDVLGFDSLANEISKEVAIKDKYCDFCTKIDGEIEYIVEAKSAAHKTLKEKDIEQAENYASRSGITWVLLTNGIDWQLYHLVFAEQEGITHDLIFSFNLVDEIENNIDKIWSLLKLISKEGILNDELESYLSQKKVLSPSSLIKILVSEPVLAVIRRELNRVSEFRLDIEDVFNSIRYVLSKDALMEAGDLCYKKKKKRRRHSIKKDDIAGNDETIIKEQIVAVDKINEQPISTEKSQNTLGLNSETSI
jgi:predicted type IV restriction endonuclease